MSSPPSCDPDVSPYTAWLAVTIRFMTSSIPPVTMQHCYKYYFVVHVSRYNNVVKYNFVVVLSVQQSSKTQRLLHCSRRWQTTKLYSPARAQSKSNNVLLITNWIVFCINKLSQGELWCSSSIAVTVVVFVELTLSFQLNELCLFHFEDRLLSHWIEFTVILQQLCFI